MPTIVVNEECYTLLEKIKRELKEQKKARGVPMKTTYGEVVKLLLHESGRYSDYLSLTGHSDAGEKDRIQEIREPPRNKLLAKKTPKKFHVRSWENLLLCSPSFSAPGSNHNIKK